MPLCTAPCNETQSRTSFFIGFKEIAVEALKPVVMMRVIPPGHIEAKDVCAVGHSQDQSQQLRVSSRQIHPSLLPGAPRSAIVIREEGMSLRHHRRDGA